MYFSCVYTNYNYEILEHALKETHSKCFPERRVRFNDKKHNKTPWITNGILRSINTRNKLYKKLKKTKTDSPNYITNKTSLNKYRNTLNKTITNAKRVYYKEIFNLYKYHMKKTWGVISEMLNRKVKNSVPETMIFAQIKLRLTKNRPMPRLSPRLVVLAYCFMPACT